jgi:hypothetical protein
MVRPIAIFYIDESVAAEDFELFTERLEKKLTEYNVICVRGNKDFVQCEIVN